MSRIVSLQSVCCCTLTWPMLLLAALVTVNMVHTTHGQLDSLGAPPAPSHRALERYFSLGGGRRQYSSDYDQPPSAFWRAYRGTWLRTNFQDWIGTRQDSNRRSKDPSNFPEWFETTKDDRTCSIVPATVNAGRPPSDICLNVVTKTSTKITPNITLQAQTDERRCICIKQHGSKNGDYKPVCGQCRDPCALRFIPRTSVEYLQKLTLGSSDEDADSDFMVDNDSGHDGSYSNDDSRRRRR